MGFFITPIEIWGHRKVKTEFDSKEQENEYIKFWTIEMTFLQRLTLLGCVYLCVIWSCHVNGSSSPWLRLKSRSWYIIICIMIWGLLQTLSLSLSLHFLSFTDETLFLPCFMEQQHQILRLVDLQLHPKNASKTRWQSCNLMQIDGLFHSWTSMRPSAIVHRTCDFLTFYTRWWILFICQAMLLSRVSRTVINL